MEAGRTTNIKNRIKLRDLVDSSLYGILVIDRSGLISFANSTVATQAGCTESELLGRTIVELMVPECQAPLARFLAEGGLKQHDASAYPCELALQRDGADSLPIQMEFLDPVIDGHQYYVCVVRDISAERNLRKELTTVKARSEDVARELQRERELNALKSRFVSTVSHEFRTPLTGILSSVNLIERYLGNAQGAWEQDGYGPRIEKHLQKIKTVVDNLTNTINDLLCLGKLEEGRIECQMAPFDLQALTISMVDHMADLRKPGQTIICQHYGDETMAVLDAHLVRNILYNLLSNAIKFSPENAPIELISHIYPGEVRIVVRDHGMGIPEADQPNLFRRFFRAENANNIPGTGLGLSIVRRYVELMGGEIGFSSETGEGTTFEITFTNANIASL